MAMYVSIKGAVPPMPKVQHDAYLIDWLEKIGTVMIGANGFVPITWAEIQSWSQMTGRGLDWWQAETLHKMSEAYANWSRKGEAVDCGSPWTNNPINKADQIKDRIKQAGTGAK